MNFEIIVLVAFLAFLSFLALLAYLKFCESHKNDLLFKVERAEQNILKSFQNLIDQVSRPSSRSRSSSSSSSSTNSSSSSSSGFHSVSRGPIRGGGQANFKTEGNSQWHERWTWQNSHLHHLLFHCQQFSSPSPKQSVIIRGQLHAAAVTQPPSSLISFLQARIEISFSG